jgi:uncharacterized protein (TIGR03435 family)
MARIFAGITVAALLSGAAFGQSTPPRPTFKIADVHVSPRIATTVLSRIGPRLDFRTSLRGERYEVRNATMVDLIRTAYSVDADKVVGGPSWLEFDRFDVTALVPPNAPQARLKPMLQSLLADRFKLVVHNDTKPIPRFVLSAGNGKHKLKEADASGNTGCQSQFVPPAAPAPGQTNVPTLAVSCHNMTVEAFAAELKGIEGGEHIANPVVDSTGLKGSWDFDVRFTPSFALRIAGSDGVTLFDAIDKQLGLKLEEQKVPAAVIVVDRVNEKPGANSPDVAQKLPPLPPAEFEVAVIKPMSGAGAIRNAGGIGFQSGGRFNVPGGLISLKELISIAWNVDTNEPLIGAPKWLDSASFDIIAKLPAIFIGANGAPPPIQEMLQALLIDRFKMKVHYENQQVTAYALVAAKPKLKKADSSARTGCKLGDGPRAANTGSFVPPSRTVTCQNMTMAQFADQLQSLAGPRAAPYFHYPVADATGLEGGWDFSFIYSLISANPAASPFGGQPAAGAAASEPVGGTSLVEAIEKQLGLKLEAQKRTYPVFVIDHIEEKPTDN